MDDLQLVLTLTGGAFRVPLKVAAKVLGIAPRTIYNRIQQKNLAFGVNRRCWQVFFRADELAGMFTTRRASTPRGAPRKAERIKAAEVELAVKDWHTRQSVTTTGIEP